jgi:hypothetical protein
MIVAVRPGLLACLCAGVTGCAILPAAGLNLAAQGAQGLVALALGPLAAMQERWERDRCLFYANKGISVTEPLESAIPRDEGEVATFQSASWRPELSLEGYPQDERSRTPTRGTLAISERSALFLPPPVATSVRTAYELAQSVEVRGSDATDEPRFLIVNCCCGRFDIVTFVRRPPNDSSPEATTVAAVHLQSRVAAFHVAAAD